MQGGRGFNLTKLSIETSEIIFFFEEKKKKKKNIIKKLRLRKFRIFDKQFYIFVTKVVEGDGVGHLT